MFILVMIDLVSALLLLWAFYLIWKEKKSFYSIGMALPAVALLTLGRFCDIFLEHPGLRHSSPFGMSAASYEALFAALGNVADVFGILLLVLSFVAIIKHEQQSALLIDQLETFLPICTYCKKYRTKNNEWLPIEKYLKENTGRQLTHGICPDCSARIRAQHLGRKHA
jgi:hypothetical protein